MTDGRTRMVADRVTTDAELRTWVARCEPGTVIEYHRGFLARDRQVSADPQRIGRIAEAAMQLASEGRLHLVQRRLGRGRFRYLAVAR